MKIKMKEHYQDANIHLAPGQIAEVDAVLGQWLLDNRKAEVVAEQREARHLDVEPQFEQAEEPPQPPMFRKPRRARGEK